MLATSASCECEGLLLVGVGGVVGTTVDGAAANMSVTLTYFVAFIVSGFFSFSLLIFQIHLFTTSSTINSVVQGV